MKPTAYVINTARGPIVDQRALHRALVDGTHRRRRASTCSRSSPCPADEPIFQLDNVIVAPHSLCWTDECFAGNGAADIRAVLEVMHGRVPRRHRQQRRGESGALGVRKLEALRRPLRRLRTRAPGARATIGRL